MVSQLLQPSCHVFVGLMLAYVVDEKSPDSAAVVCGGNSAIPLLSCSVPDLGFDGLGVDLDRSSGKLDSDGRLRI
jgi:hypothetical protein